MSNPKVMFNTIGYGQGQGVLVGFVAKKITIQSEAQSTYAIVATDSGVFVEVSLADILLAPKATRKPRVRKARV